MPVTSKFLHSDPELHSRPQHKAEVAGTGRHLSRQGLPQGAQHRLPRLILSWFVSPPPGLSPAYSLQKALKHLRLEVDNDEGELEMPHWP